MIKNITVDARMINSSGIGTFIKNVLKRIINIKKEWKFNIIGNVEELSKFDFLNFDNVKLIDCRVPIYSIREQFALLLAIPKDTDIFWSPHYNIPIFYTGKLVVTVHDVFHLAMPQFVKGIHKKIYSKFMFHMVKEKANKIIVVSKFTAKELKRLVNVPEEKISVIYNGVDNEWFNIKYGKKVYHKPYILYVGNVKPHKNLITLLKAFTKVKDRIEQDLIIVGKKDGFITGDNRLNEFINNNEGRIIFTGFVENDILKQYYKQADIFVFPSLYEGFGLPPLEALAAGCKKIICSDIPAIREIYNNSILYFNPYDVNDISRILIQVNNEKYLFPFSFSKYNWDIAVKKYEKVFENVCGGGIQ